MGGEGKVCLLLMAVCVAVKGVDWMDVSKRESPTASSFYSIIERNATPAHARGFGRFSAPHEDGIARSGLITNPVIATRNLSHVRTALNGTWTGGMINRLINAQREGSTLAALMADVLKPCCLLLVIHDGTMEGVPDVLQGWRRDGRAGASVMTYDLTRIEQALRSSSHMGDTRNVVLMCSSANVLLTFQMVRNNSLESETLRWYVMAEEEVSTTLIPVLREGSQVALLIRHENSSSHYVIKSSLIQLDNTVSFQRRGTWRGPNRDEKLIRHDLIFLELSRVYADFKGRELVVSVINNWPFFGVKYLPDGTPEADSGLDVSVLQALSRTLNFTFRLTEPEDRQWGGPQPDGSVTGMIGQVARHEAHLAINEITITGTREAVVDFTQPYFTESTTLVSRAPAEKNRAFAIFSPFTPLTWGLVALSTVTIGVLVWPMSSTSSYASNLSLETPSPSSSSTSSSFGLWQESTFSAYRALVRQGSVVAPSSAFSLRLLLAIWYIFCYVIYAMYSGTLTAFLARPSFERPVDSLTDLIRASKDGFIPVFLAGSSNEFIFREATQGLFKEVWEARDPARSLSPTIDGGMDGVLSDKRVFINAKLSSVIRAAVRGSHRFYQAAQTIYPQGYGVVCRSGAPYKSKFETVLARMVESGLVDKWTQDQVNQVRKTGQTYAGNDKRPKAITIYHLQAAFFLLALGIILSTLVLLIELCLCI